MIEFKVHGSGKRLFGDGFAFWYARDRMVLGPVFGSKDHFVGLSIFFDTYSNHNGPHHVRPARTAPPRGRITARSTPAPLTRAAVLCERGGVRSTSTRTSQPW